MIQEAREAAAEAAKMYEAGEISKEEFANLLLGLKVEEMVTVNAEQLHEKEELNKYINTVIAGLSLVA